MRRKAPDNQQNGDYGLYEETTTQSQTYGARFGKPYHPKPNRCMQDKAWLQTTKRRCKGWGASHQEMVEGTLLWTCLPNGCIAHRGAASNSAGGGNAPTKNKKVSPHLQS